MKEIQSNIMALLFMKTPFNIILKSKYLNKYLFSTLIIFICSYLKGQEVRLIQYLQDYQHANQYFSVSYIENPFKKNQISFKASKNIYFDSEGLVWITSENGLIYYDGVQFNNYFPAYRNQANERPTFIFEINRDVLLIVYTSKSVASFTPTGFDLFNINSGKFRLVSLPGNMKDEKSIFSQSNKGELSLFYAKGQEYILNPVTASWKKRKSNILPDSLDYKFKVNQITLGANFGPNRLLKLNENINSLRSGFLNFPLRHFGNVAEFSIGIESVDTNKDKIIYGNNGQLDLGKSYFLHHPKGIAKNKLKYFFTPASNEIWIHYKNLEKLVAFDLESGKTKVSIATTGFMGDEEISTIAVKGKHIFISTNSSHIIWLTRFSSPINKLKCENMSIRSFFQQADSLLIGTYSGILLMRGKINTNTVPENLTKWFNSLALLNENTVVYDFLKERNNLWLGLSSRLLRINSKQEIENFQSPQDLPCGDIWEMISLNDSTLLIGCDGGIKMFDFQHQIWNNITFNGKNLNRTYGFVPFGPGEWIAYGENGFYKLQRLNGKWIVSNRPFKNFNDIKILFVLPESAKSWWIATRTGLIHFNPTQGIKMNQELLGITDGMEMYAVYMHSPSKYWVSGDAGIYFIDLPNRNVVHFGNESGLKETEFNRNAHIRLKDGSILFGNIKGGNIIQPNWKPETRLEQRPTVIVKTTNHLPLAFDVKKNIHYIDDKEAGIYIHIKGLYHKTEKSRFAYRIPELGSQWVLGNGKRIFVPKPNRNEWTLEIYREIDRSWIRVKDLKMVRKQKLSTRISVYAILLILVITIFLISKTYYKRNRKPLNQGRIYPEKPSEDQLLRNEDQHLFSLLNKKIEEEYMDSNLTVNHLASKIGISERSLYRLVKVNIDTTPNDLLKEFRLQIARKSLIENPEKTISEIAYACGFNSPSYFSKCFQEKFDISPRQFQRKCLQQKTTKFPPFI